MLSPRVGWGGRLPMGNLLSKLFPGGDFDIQVLPWVWEFDTATTCCGQKAAPRGGNLTFSRCPRMGNLTLALVKMSNFPGSTHPPLNSFICITQQNSNFSPSTLLPLTLAATLNHFFPNSSDSWQ